MAFAIIVMSLLFATASFASEDCDWQLRVVAPEVALPDRITPILVTLKIVDTRRRDAANVTLKLIADGAETHSRPLVQMTVPIEGQGVFAVTIPKDVSGYVSVYASVDCSDNTSDTLTTLRILSTIRDVIIRPMSKYYKPGEKVEFWILALDHDFYMASDVSGKVFVADPRGTKVAVWEDILFDQGVKKFVFAISTEALEGKWQLGVSIEEETFSYDVNVSLARGSMDPLTPDLVIAEEHFVELRFAPEMRRRYKPGLPFVGKIEAVSSEKAVRVRVKVLDNTTSIYSQDIEMALGEGTFVVPAILSDSNVIVLQAELVSVAGKETDSHYVLAKEPIFKWNSSSSCYLLIEGMEDSLLPGQVTRATILSSCPCDQSLNYVITTEGRVTFWSQIDVTADDQVPPPVSTDGAAICRINFKFIVQAVMAPVSHFLVYYVTHEGEPISDVITFDVKLLQRKAILNLERRETWYPGDPMDVEVLTKDGSLVCLIGGRGSESQYSQRSESVDFSQAGLLYLHRGCTKGVCIGKSKPSQYYPLATGRNKQHSSVMPHIGLEQLWIWECFNYTSEIEATGIIIPAPQLPGKWMLFALLISPSPSPSVGFSHPVFLSVFRPIEVEFQLAKSIVTGESLEVDVKIGNNVNSCVDVNALLSLNEGAHFSGVNQPFVAEKLRLGPQGATSLVVRIVATTAGIKNMTVEVSAFISDTCQATSTNSAPHGNHSLVGSVVRSATVNVYHEGLVRRHTESAYFCANEKMIISPKDTFNYETIQAPRNRDGLIFEVRADGGVHIALTDGSTHMYQIILDNSVSYLLKGKYGYGVHLKSSKTPRLLSAEESQTFWINWGGGRLSVGNGFIFHKRPILDWKYDKRMRITHIGFATSWRHKGDFRIWNYNDEAGFSQVLHLDIPRSVLPGSETGILTVNGGMSLSSVPHISQEYCKEYNCNEYSSLSSAIAQVAPLLFINQTNSSVRHQLAKDIQVLLSYRQDDNSFGNYRNVSSHWFTVQVLDLLSRAQTFVGVDTDLISSIKNWLRNRQDDEGSFYPEPFEFVVDNTTDFNLRIETTAATIATLLEVGVEKDDDSVAVLKARYYLERHIYKVNDGYTLALLSYALVLANSEMASLAMDRLCNVSTNEEGDFGWPRPPDNSDWLYEEGAGQTNKPTATSSVTDFKASIYTLMAYTLLGDLKSAEPVARYLFYRSHVLDRHTELVYVAMKAFTKFSLLAEDPHRSLTLSLATSGMELTDTLELRPESIIQNLPLPSLPTKVFVYATGAGCATVQGHISYATYSPPRTNSLLEIGARVEQEILPAAQELDGKLPILDVKTCFRWKGSEPSGVLRGEIHLFSGFHLNSLKSSKGVDIQYGSRDDRVWFALNNISSECATCVRLTIQSAFLVRGLRPALSRVYPATRPDLAVETFFTSPLLTDTTDDDYISWFNSHSGIVDDDSQNWMECGQPVQDVKTKSSSSENDSKGLTLTDMIILSDVHQDVLSSTDVTDYVGSETKSSDYWTTATTLDLVRETTSSDDDFDNRERVTKSNVSNADETVSTVPLTLVNVTGSSNGTEPTTLTYVSSVSETANVTASYHEEDHVTQETHTVATVSAHTVMNTPKSDFSSTEMPSSLHLTHQENFTLNTKKNMTHLKLNRFKDEHTLNATKDYILTLLQRTLNDSHTNSTSIKIRIFDYDKFEKDNNAMLYNVTQSHEAKRINHNIEEITLLSDSTTKSPSIIETATIAKSTSEKFLILDRSALWDMLREGARTEEYKKKGG